MRRMRKGGEDVSESVSESRVGSHWHHLRSGMADECSGLCTDACENIEGMGELC